jgi:hypothetical protein
MSFDETALAVKEAEKALGALEKMNGLSVAVDYITKRSQGSSYHLLILNSLEKTVQVQGYDRESFAQAEEEYSKIERRAIEGEKIEPVLVSAGSIEKLRRAYPSFFLDIGDFVNNVMEIVNKN